MNGHLRLTLTFGLFLAAGITLTGCDDSGNKKENDTDAGDWDPPVDEGQNTEPTSTDSATASTDTDTWTDALMSVDELEARFDALFQAANKCETDEDCVLVTLDCPLPCAVAVDANHQSDFENATSDLVREYNDGRNAVCEYDCDPPQRTLCTAEGKCTFSFPQSQD